MLRSISPTELRLPALAMMALLSAGSGAQESPAPVRLDADKMAFNCVVGLPLAVHGLSLGEYLDGRREEARAVFDEALGVCAGALGAQAESDAWERFLLSAQPLGWVRVANAKALEFRNGAVVELARRHGSEAPVNEELMRGRY